MQHTLFHIYTRLECCPFLFVLVLLLIYIIVIAFHFSFIYKHTVIPKETA